MKKAKITISIPENQLNSFRKIAQQQERPLAHVITDRLQSSACRPTTAQLLAASEKVRREYRGFLSRDQAMHITSIALNCLHQETLRVY
jgi:glutamate-1-semialdehyde aminotransferase|tara:strand:- start:749 stop:1015 length:267 start_codon:yes stop_codon:yes gene_type:complete